MEYCPHCMRPASGEVCTHCGGQINWTAALGQLPLGTLLRGSKNQTYMIGAARGQGGFGITYAAINLNTSERVAIKEYYPTRCALRTTLHQVMPMTGQDQTYRNGIKSFLEEAMMLSAVGALPSVVTVTDYFEANGTAYLVMEYIDGIPLHEVVSRRGKIPAAELMPKLEPLLQDLAILHKARVIHRDISPDNLMLMPDGSLKLLDFGSARSVQDGKAMTVLLKAGFSPVEQYQSRGQGPWTDVYALAGTIYYCLTGVIPPTAVDRLDSDDLVAPNALGAQLTPAQEKALLWGLTVQPKARPSDMAEFRQQLFGLGDSPVQVQLPGKRTPTTVKETMFLKDLEDDTTSFDPGRTTVLKPENRPVTRQEAPVASKKPPKWLFFVIGGVVVTLLLLFIIGVNSEDGSGGDEQLQASQEDTQSTTQPTTQAPEQTAPPTTQEPEQTAPPTTQAPEQTTPPAEEPYTEGTTADGYTYQINAARTECIITGYTGTEKLLEIPDTVDDVPVTVIEEKAFSGLSNITRVSFHSNMKEIRDRAFAGCSSLTGIVNHSIASAATGAFDNCPLLRYALLVNETSTVDGWTLPDRVRTYRKGMETGVGKLWYTTVSSKGVIYAFTEDEQAVVMDIPEGMTEIDIMDKLGDTPVKWIHEDALDHVDPSIKITLPAETLFPYKLWNQATWLFNGEGGNYTTGDCTLAQCWYISCRACAEINEQRPANAPKILPDEKLLRAAMLRAEELVISDDIQWRPDDCKWSTILDDFEVSCRYAATWKCPLSASVSGFSQYDLADAFNGLAEAYAPMVEDWEEYYTGLSIGLSYDAVNNLYQLACLIIVE